MLDVDYLVIGAGAMGMAFVDTLIDETDYTVALVDRYHQPGGHWNKAYPFVRLHQPSSFYGVNSTSLGSGRIDQSGWNKGLSELATAAEVCAYYDCILNQKLIPTGRVSFFPMNTSDGANRIRSVSGVSTEFNVKRRVVDATYMNVTVPSMRPPGYEVDEQVICIPINDLVKLDRSFENYVVIGAGKTGIDACLWLLKIGINPDQIHWVMPRDSWLLDRAALQPDPQFLDSIRAGVAAQNDAIMKASSIDDLFDRLESAKRLLRLSLDIKPSMYRCATVSTDEFAQLKHIRNVVRMGRVRSIERGSVQLDDGELQLATDTVYVDCSADGLERRPSLPVFQDKRMTLQTIRSCQQVFSASFIAHVEADYANDEEKNSLCGVVPHPDSATDWIRANIGNNRNQIRWIDDERLQKWLAACRLNGARAARPPLPEDPTERRNAIEQSKKAMTALNERLTTLLQ
jgi:hypothetical protein